MSRSGPPSRRRRPGPSPSVCVRATDSQPVPMIVYRLSTPCTPYQKRSGWCGSISQGPYVSQPTICAELRVVRQRGDAGAEAERRAGEAGRPALPGEVEDRDGVGQRAGDRLVDEHRLAGLEHGPRLLQVRPAVDALEQHDVDLRQQLVDRADDLDAVLLLQVARIARHAVAAGGDVGAAAGIGGDDPHAGELGPGMFGVQELGECDHVRRIEADDPGLEWRRCRLGRRLRFAAVRHRSPIASHAPSPDRTTIVRMRIGTARPSREPMETPAARTAGPARPTIIGGRAGSMQRPVGRLARNPWPHPDC